MSAFRHSDVLAVLEAAALAGGSITRREVRSIEASQAAQCIGWATVVYSGDVATVTLTDEGTEYLELLMGENWQEKV